MSKEDLIPFNKIDPETRRKMQSNGGKKSGETRRRNRAMKEYMTLLLSLPAVNSKMKEKLKKRGVPVEEIDNKMLVINALWEKALSGDVQAIKEVRSIIGEVDSFGNFADSDITVNIVKAKKAKAGD